MYFNGVPVKVFFDTGAQRTMVTRETAERIGLPIRRPRNPLRIRNVEDKLGSIIDEVIRQASCPARCVILNHNGTYYHLSASSGTGRGLAYTFSLKSEKHITPKRLA